MYLFVCLWSRICIKSFKELGQSRDNFIYSKATVKNSNESVRWPQGIIVARIEKCSFKKKVFKAERVYTTADWIGNWDYKQLDAQFYYNN